MISKNKNMLEVQRLYLEREEELLSKYNRSLPFQDAIFDRWERATRLGFGEKTSIYNSAFVFGEVSVGENTWIGPYVVLDGSGGKLSIGDYCSISAGVHIYTHDSVEWAVTGGKCKARLGDIKISNCCYIGAQSVIKAGVSIGKHVVVGAKSFVNKNIEDYQIVVGTPSKVIGHVEIDGKDVKFIYYNNNSS